MEPTDVTIQILRRIQEGIAGTNTRLEALQSDVNERFGSLEKRMASVETRLESGFAATSAAIGVLTEQVTFYGRSATAAAEARLRPDERIDRLEQRMDALENRDH